MGDVPLEDITLQSEGLKYLVDFKPPVETNDLVRISRELSNGIKADGYVYRLGFYARSQTTFALRLIAYKGSFMRSQNGVAYDEFRFDKRRDILVVFRIVDRESNGNITIVWKKLAERDAPTLKISDQGASIGK